MVSADLLATLCCPATRLPVRMAEAREVAALNAAIAANEVVDGRGAMRMPPLDAALVREDGAAWFPVLSGIPLMTCEEMLQRAG